jgi:methylenetetrahydrofolate dehydrogenase (NADP+)/methenyltetrahydrofolate cyclohydrolase
MTAKLIDGKVVAEAVRREAAAETAKLKAQTGQVPTLAAVLVGDNPASQSYVASKGKACEEAGMGSLTYRLPATSTQAEVEDLVRSLNADPVVNGILVQLPLPKGIDARRVIDAIDPAKDVDGLTAVNAGRLVLGERAIVPCTPLGCSLLIDAFAGDVRGAAAVVIGRSNLVGKPVAQLLLQRDCTVTIAHSRTRDLAAVVRGADIVVAAVGRPEMVRGDWIKPGAVVIDVGINRVAPAKDEGQDGKGRLVGDVAFAEAAAVARAITPVPGGVGPMTIACLLQNTWQACRARRGLVDAA